MRKQLHYFLSLRIAVRITGAVWSFQIFGITWTTVIVISPVGEVGSVISVYFDVVWSNVIWGTVDEIFGVAPSFGGRVDNHLTVSGNVCENISVAGCAIVLPAAAYVN